VKTPVDPVVRLQRRSVDDLRAQISVEISHVGAIEAAFAAVEADVAAQYRVVAGDWAMQMHGFAQRRRADRAKLDAQRRDAMARLDRLRSEAAEAYGKLKAAEDAAERFREDANAAIALAEQNAADDFALGRFVARKAALSRAERRA
jgi:flagellar biosynthesis chaperone FliJ